MDAVAGVEALAGEGAEKAEALKVWIGQLKEEIANGRVWIRSLLVEWVGRFRIGGDGDRGHWSYDDGSHNDRSYGARIHADVNGFSAD